MDSTKAIDELPEADHMWKTHIKMLDHIMFLNKKKAEFSVLPGLRHAH